MVTKLATNNESGLTIVGGCRGAVPSGPALCGCTFSEPVEVYALAFRLYHYIVLLLYWKGGGLIVV